jgi:ubiquinone biosynthesis protein Coq4
MFMLTMNVFRNGLLLARAAWGFVDLVRHPTHLDRVFQISEKLVNERRDLLELMRDHLAKDPRGATSLRERPRLEVRLEELDKLPPGTFGRAFADHMRKNNLDPAAIPTLPSRNEFEYLQAHLYETHDVWHAVTGFDTDVAGELGLQSFYAAQMPGGLPYILLAAGFLNTAFLSMDDRERRLDAVVRGWQMGRSAKPLFGVVWGELWSKPVSEVRELFGVQAIPQHPDRMASAARA